MTRSLLTLSLLLVVAAAHAERINEKANNLSISSFSDIVSAIGKESIAGISLSELVTDVKRGKEHSIVVNNDKLNYTLAIYGFMAKSPQVGFSLQISRCCKYFGVTYEQAVEQLTALANKLGAKKSEKGGIHYPVGDQYGVRWEWSNNVYDCTMYLDNEYYFGGDFDVNCGNALKNK